MTITVGVRAQSSNFEIAVGDHFGPIRPTTTRAQLPGLFGKDAVKDRAVPIGEGMCVPGTVVFADQPNEVEIAWQDKARTRIAFARVSKPGEWHTVRGVRVGTSLRQLESIAGKALTFLGFGWDYGGGMKWIEGNGSLGIELDPDPDQEELTKSSPDIFGDRDVRSDHPTIRKMKISVIWLSQNWGQPVEQIDCP